MERETLGSQKLLSSTYVSYELFFLIDTCDLNTKSVLVSSQRGRIAVKVCNAGMYLLTLALEKYDAITSLSQHV